mgnify:CR=1 FL=1
MKTHCEHEQEQKIICEFTGCVKEFRLQQTMKDHFQAAHNNIYKF